MARSVDQIKAQIDEQLADKASLSTIITNPSQTSIWKDFRHAIAVCLGVFEQLLDAFKTEMDERIDTNIVGTYPWLKNKLFEFQYDSTTPQVVELIDNVPQYAVVDESKRILSVVVVRYTAANIPYIWVAKNDPPVKLVSAELTALQGYLTDGGNNSSYGVGIGMAGVKYEVYSQDPDFVFIEATCKYDGKIAGMAQSLVEDALNEYLRYGLNERGYLVVNDLVKVVKDIDGVVDFELKNLGIRDYATAFASKFMIVDNFEVVVFTRQVVAGYCTEETDTGNTWGDKITYTPISL